MENHQLYYLITFSSESSLGINKKDLKNKHLRIDNNS